ncbi:delta-60 repeat domain-containing protein [Streptomyces vinaceus]|uniref:delta-60 repeat domain-containing protein n=1 Tax=Streptomyces vinaceus TaxID=1960 RepID=UPI0035DADD13
MLSVSRRPGSPARRRTAVGGPVLRGRGRVPDAHTASALPRSRAGRPGSGGCGRWWIARYTPDGRLDRSFGSGGIVLTPMSGVGGDDEHIWRLAVQKDGKIVAAGHVATAAGGEDFAVARYLPDGRLDHTFGTQGRVMTALTPHDDEAQALRIQHDGRIVVAGYAGTGEGTDGRDFALVRHPSDGRLDRSFNRAGPRPGTVVTDIEGGRDQFRDITMDTRGRIVAAGSATLPAERGGTSFAVARYLGDGSPDSAFGYGVPRPGVVVTPMAANGGLDLAESVVIDRHDRILAGGSTAATEFTVDSDFLIAPMVCWVVRRLSPATWPSPLAATASVARSERRVPGAGVGRGVSRPADPVSLQRQGQRGRGPRVTIDDPDCRVHDPRLRSFGRWGRPRGGADSAAPASVPFGR